MELIAGKRDGMAFRGFMGMACRSFCKKFKGRKGIGMGFCEKCGSELKDGDHFCPACGMVRKGQGDGSRPEEKGGGGETAEDRALAALAYMGPLVFVALCLAKGKKFIRFHASQGTALLLASVVYGIAFGVLEKVVLTFFWRAYAITGLIGITGAAFPALACIGIVNAVGGQEKELPVIGRFIGRL